MEGACGAIGLMCSQLIAGALAERGAHMRASWSVVGEVVAVVVVGVLGLCGHARPALGATPSNAQAAFRQVSLLSPSGGTGYATGGHLTWPTFLDSLLIRAIGGTDSIQIKSTRSQGVSVGLNGSVTYTLPPKTFANRVGAIVTANDWTDGSETGFPVLTASFTFSDGRTWGTGTLFDVSSGLGYPFLLRFRVRTWSDQVVPGNPDFVAQPLNPAVFPLCAQASNGGVGNVFSDLQTFGIPDTLRNAELQTVTFASHTTAFDSTHITSATGLVSGLAVWPQFKVANAQGDTVVRQSQATGADHGGYLFGSQPVGMRRKTDDTACQVASMAMCYTYAGFPCTLDSLNAHLQRNKGYEPSDVCIVKWVSPTGDTIRYRPYTKDDTRLKVGDRFLVERGNYVNPLATFEVTDTTLRQAVLVPPRHNLTTPVVEGDRGRVYWNMIFRQADKYTQNPRLVSKQIGDSPGLAAHVESLLVRNIPVQLNLKTYGHMIVADGWTPSFRPAGTARGTYSIKDPYNPRNFTRLIESRMIAGKLANYRDLFKLARWVEPAPGPEPPGATGVAGTGVPSLSVLTNGTRRLELVDPLGRRMLRDAGTDEDVAEIPDAWVMDVGSEHDDGDDWDDRQTGYQVDVAEVLNGHYLLRVYADEGHAVNISAYDESGVFSTDAVGDTAVVAVGASYDIHYSAAARTVAVSYLGPLGVEPPVTPARHIHFAVRGNPATGPAEFVLAAPPDAGDAIEVFDPGGRRVGVVRVAPGERVVRWDWRDGQHRAGVYLARLRSGSEVVRFVILR